MQDVLKSLQAGSSQLQVLLVSFVVKQQEVWIVNVIQPKDLSGAQLTQVLCGHVSGGCGSLATIVQHGV